MFQQNNINKIEWDKHYQNSGNLFPAKTLIKALEFFKNDNMNSGAAIDLGCGSGIDSIELLKNNWSVIAIDKEAKASELLLSQIHPFVLNKVKTLQASFEEVELPNVDLINATFSLPFCKPEYFPEFWNRIVKSIRKGGRFSGQLFGVNDCWSSNTEMTFHTLEEVQFLFREFELEFFLETQKDGLTISGAMKHWHVFHIVARKQ